MSPKPTIPIVFSTPGEENFVDPATLAPTLFTQPKFLKGVILGLGDLVGDHESRIRTITQQLEPVLWICYNPKCGAPNQTPRLLFPFASGVALTLLCTTCQWTQPWEHVKQFLPVVE